MKPSRVGPVLLASLALSGCAGLVDFVAPASDRVMPAFFTEPGYEELFPYYVELCAVSQFRPAEGAEGGIPGHGVLYLKGVCRDASARYPSLVPCDAPTAERAGGKHGVGVSVNKIFKSVNWMVSPGKRIFMDGNLPEGGHLTRAYFDGTLERSIEMGMFEGIEAHAWYMEQKPDGATDAEWIATEAIGTDYALRFSRNVFCARVPVTRAMILRSMAFLNELNADYADGETDYEWHGYYDNCVHTVHNALASADIWEPKSVRAIGLAQLKHVAIPANEFADLSVLSMEGPLEDFSKIWASPAMRRSLMQEGWLPTRHGALLKTSPIFQDNDLFDTRFRIFVMESVLLREKSKRARRMLADPRYTNLEANLVYFVERYDSILAGRAAAEGSPGKDPEFEAGRARYYAYIAEQRADAQAKLERLRAITR